MRSIDPESAFFAAFAGMRLFDPRIVVKKRA
jgi:hypothetical protein